jgi:thiol-disulfide isomerase/thioredoxin
MDRLEDVYPIALMPYIALLFGMLLSKKSGQKSYILYGAIGLYIIVMILSWQFFMPSYLTYSFNKEFHALEDNNLDFPELEVYNSSKEKVDLHIFDNKVLVLDIWTRSCGICFKRFPDFEALSQQYKGREDIVFYALNKLNYNDNLDSIISLANNLPYEFPHLFTLPSWNGEIKEKLNVSYFPMMVVRTKNGKLIYIGGGSTVYEKGTYRNAKSVIDDLL